MSTTEEPKIFFYQNLGQLFYAIAASDKVVRKAEYEALKKIVIDHWKDSEAAKDEYKESVTYQMEIVFEWFDYEQMDAQECFDSFYAYAKEHPKAFVGTRELIEKTAEAIANAFAGINEKEISMLNKLKMLFRELNTD